MICRKTGSSMKYVLVSEVVVSGLGKGAIGIVLKACGLCVTSIKIDTDMNTNVGTMFPFEHRKDLVLDDGERFVNLILQLTCSTLILKCIHFVIEKERRGDYLGKTVQVILLDLVWIMFCMNDFIGADMVNTCGRQGGIITAALFRKQLMPQFVDEKVQWIHIDTASGAVPRSELLIGFNIETLVELVLLNSSS
ncbi:CTP synthase 1 [Linum perenne]